MPRKPFTVPAGVRKGLPQFVRKLVEILETAPKQIVEWTRDGTAFAVHNLPRFCSEVLGRHFRSSQFNSFMRQLNFYNFRKVEGSDITPGMMDQEPPRTTEFTHAHLKRGDWTSLRQIKRKTSSEYHVSYEVELKALRAENLKLKQDLAAANAHARTMQEQRDLARVRARAVLDAARAAGMSFHNDALMALHEVADEVEVEELDDLDMTGGGGVGGTAPFAFYDATGSVRPAVGGTSASASGASSHTTVPGATGVLPAGTATGSSGSSAMSASGSSASAGALAWSAPMTPASTALVAVPKHGRMGRARMRLPHGATMRVPRLPPAAGSGSSSSLVRMRHNKRRRTASPGRAASLSPSLGVSADPTGSALTYMQLPAGADSWRNADVNHAIASLFDESSPGGTGVGGYGDTAMLERLRGVDFGDAAPQAMGNAIDLDSLSGLDDNHHLEVGARGARSGAGATAAAAGGGAGTRLSAGRGGRGGGGTVSSAQAGQPHAAPYTTTRLGPPPRGVTAADVGAMSPLGPSMGSSHGRGGDSGDWSLDFADGDLSWLDLSPSAAPGGSMAGSMAGSMGMPDGEGMLDMDVGEDNGDALDQALRGDGVADLDGDGDGGGGVDNGGVGATGGVAPGTDPSLDIDPAAPLWRGISAISLDSAGLARDSGGGDTLAGAQGGTMPLTPVLTPPLAGGGGPDPAVVAAGSVPVATAAAVGVGDAVGGGPAAVPAPASTTVTVPVTAPATAPVTAPVASAPVV